MRRPKVWFTLGICAGVLVVERSMRAAFSGDRRRPSGSARTYVLERTQMIPVPVEQVFAFFEKPENLGTITPPWMGFEIVGLENLPIQRGTKIEYRIRPLGVPQRWATEIVEYEPGHRFVDLQTEGPYRYWRHQHEFSASGGRTLMRDRVEYQMPLGLLGRIVQGLVVARQLRRVFDYRTGAITRRFGPYDDVERCGRLP